MIIKIVTFLGGYTLDTFKLKICDFKKKIATKK